MSFDRNNQVTADGVGDRQIISQSRIGLFKFLQLGKILIAELNSKSFFQAGRTAPGTKPFSADYWNTPAQASVYRASLEER